MSRNGPPGTPSPPAAPSGAVATDPVCGMTVNPTEAAGTHRHAGRTYFFCSRDCLDRFRADPHAFVGYSKDIHKKAHEHPRTADTTEDTAEYTCPMHPEIRQIGPGACPICGMALEPVNVTLDDAPNEELIDMERHFKWSLALTAPIVALMVDDILPGHPMQRLLPSGARNWVELALATPVVLWAGWPFFQRGWASVVSRHLNMFTLIGLGVVAAYAYSLVAVLVPGVVPEAFKNHGEPEVYFEASAVIVALVLLGQVLELRARQRTGGAIRELLSLAPPTARVVRDGPEQDVPLEHVQLGDTLKVLPGERVPVDGAITSGRSFRANVRTCARCGCRASARARSASWPNRCSDASCPAIRQSCRSWSARPRATRSS